ncbi:hypothetical protein BU15DRAFT_81003 [Melanogaster broomeanus]|nr:hypothetical protein BU15DRAFT_81003 [Melanogaster broomeanus]
MSYPYPATPFFMPPWPAPVQGSYGGNGMLYPPYSQPMTVLSPVVQTYPSPQPSTPQSLTTTLPQPHGTSPPNSLGSASVVPIPDVVPWFKLLEICEKNPPRGIKFSDFGPILEGKGFIHMSQCPHKYIPIEMLQQWLGIEYGTAVLIFQSMEADMRAISTGQLLRGLS